MRKQMIVVMALVAVLGPGLMGYAGEHKTDQAPTPEQRVDQLFEKWNNPGSPGAAVAVVQQGMVVYRKGFGSAHVEYNVPITPSTVFHVASVSKQFPAFAITMLEEQGKLSVDDDIRMYLPWMHDFGHKITIRHLLNHTSGIRDQWELLILSGWRIEDVITQRDILYLLKRQRQLNFIPGDRYMYSNSGFTLLTEIVARVTGQPFVEWVDRHIFKPLGMNSSHFHLDHQRIVKNRAYSYRIEKKRGLVKSLLSYANVGATSLFTTVEDMANWIRNFSEIRVGSEAVIGRMVTPGVLNDGTVINYARGLGVGEYKGLKRIGHGGADAGFRTYMEYFPEQDFGVVVLSNLAQFNPGEVAHKIVDIYLADEIASRQSEVPETPSRTPIKLSKRKLRSFTGRFWMPRSRIVRDIALEGKTLFYVRTAQNRSQLVCFADNRFFMKDVPQVTMEFSDIAAGRAQKIRVVVGREVIEGDRVEPFEPTVEDLTAYSGRYESDELEVMFKLAVGEKGLALDYKKQDDDPYLVPLIEDVFSTSGGYSTLHFQRDKTGTVTGFLVNTGRVKNLAFKRIQ